MAKKRKRAGRRSRKSFKRAANRTHVSNVSRGLKRGGYRR